eukprot:SAG31_NODE_3963_length_3716_cov_3.038430_4_plen_79_part_00
MRDLSKDAGEASGRSRRRRGVQASISDSSLPPVRGLQHVQDKYDFMKKHSKVCCSVLPTVAALLTKSSDGPRAHVLRI